MTSARLTRRVMAGQRCVTGYLLLTHPVRVAGAIAPAEPPPPKWLIRILGGRILVQSAVQLVWPSRGFVISGTVSDALHAATMLAAAARWPGHRSAAIASGVEASVSAAISAGTLAVRCPPTHATAALTRLRSL